MNEKIQDWFDGWPVFKGGPGSGFHGHGGRPGQQGGSAPGGATGGVGGSVEIGGPRSPVQIGERTTTLRKFTRVDIPKVRDAMFVYEKGRKLAVKPKRRFSVAIDKLNSVKGALGKPKQGQVVRDAAKVVERFEQSGVKGIVFRDLFF